MTDATFIAITTAVSALSALAGLFYGRWRGYEEGFRDGVMRGRMLERSHARDINVQVLKSRIIQHHDHGT